MRKTQPIVRRLRNVAYSLLPAITRGDVPRIMATETPPVVIDATKKPIAFMVFFPALIIADAMPLTISRTT